MNSILANSNKYYYGVSVAYYYGYAYLAVEKFIENLTSEY